MCEKATEVTAAQVKELREKTGAGIMDCKKTLRESGGDVDKAITLLREWGAAAAQKREGRATTAGLIESYVHGARVGVMVEVNCETDFVANTQEFKQFCHEIAMQIAALRPEYVAREDVPEEVKANERHILAEQAKREGKPEKIIERMVEGRLNKFYEAVCLLDQAYMRDDSKKIGDLLQDLRAKLGENIVVRRFVRYALGQE